MTDPVIELTEDAFLGGQLRLKQLKSGHRAGHDAVLLAAATAARPGDRVADLGEGEFNAGDAPDQAQTGGTDSGAEFNHAIARPRRRRGRQQHGVMAGAVAGPGLAQPQLSAEKCILGEFIRRDAVRQFSHRPAIHGRARHR